MTQIFRAFKKEKIAFAMEVFFLNRNEFKMSMEKFIDALSEREGCLLKLIDFKEPLKNNKSFATLKSDDNEEYTIIYRRLR